jgi:hypothetical protein
LILPATPATASDAGAAAAPKKNMPTPALQTYFREQLLGWLLDDQQLSDVVSNRGFIDRVPQGQAMPNLVIFEIHSEPYNSLQGEVGYARSVLQIDAWADGANGRILAKRVALRVRTKLAGNVTTADAPFRGLLAPGGIWLESARCTRDQLLGERAEDGTDNYRFRASLDFDVIHTEQAAEV